MPEECSREEEKKGKKRKKKYKEPSTEEAHAGRRIDSVSGREASTKGAIMLNVLCLRGTRPRKVANWGRLQPN